jgi:hypothetical protein
MYPSPSTAGHETGLPAGVQAQVDRMLTEILGEYFS